MKQMLRKHPLFSHFIALCLTWENKTKQKSTQGPPWASQQCWGPSPAFPPLRFPAHPQHLSHWPQRGTTSITQPQCVASLELRRCWSPYILLPGEN